MEMIQTQEKVIIVDRKPTPNAFFAALAETTKIQTPNQIFRAQIRLVEKAAEAGDIRGWQENSASLATLASDAGIDLTQDLEIRVQLKKIELSLLMNAQRKASSQAKGLEKQATELQIAGDVNGAKDLFAKAQKLITLSLQLKGQLEARLA
jgi:hypothetical protein